MFSRINYLGLLAFCFALVLFTPLSRITAEEIKDSACMDCHSDKDLYKTNSAGKGVLLYVDQERIRASVHRTNSCASCHADITENHPDDEVAAKPVHCARCHEAQSETYGASAHGLALANGQLDSATCKDCHDSHSILRPTSAESPLHFSRLAETCGGCHDEAARDVEASVHGTAVALGHREAPTCTDCHSEHKITTLKGTNLKSSAQMCSNCHASERLNTKFKLPADRVKTFFDSYHGLATQYGSTVAANCESCHGFHKILPSSDSRSTIHPDNLIATCGKCHAGATANFVNSKIHIDASVESTSDDTGGMVNWWVRRIYLVLIFATIGFMLVHNGLLFLRKVKTLHRNLDLPILRMDLCQRWQHFVLALSFIILAWTGFALKFPDSWVSRLLGSNELLRSWSHRVAGVVLLVVGAYHIYYVIVRKEGRQLVKDLLPVTKDLKDLGTNARYLSGISQEKAKIGRFGYAEKMEYWAVVWGTIIMGVTGLMIWFKVDVTQFFPRWVVDVATTIHYYEAILACLAIIVWHFYHVIFDPDVYPLNTACLNGRVTKQWMEEEHTLVTDHVSAETNHRPETEDRPSKG